MITTAVYIGTSLDGFIAKKDGNIDWLVKFESPEIGESYMQFMRNIDVHVIGRNTFDKVLTFDPWPFEKKVFVLSTTLNDLPNHLKQKVEIISMAPREVLKYLSDLGFSNIYIDGAKVIQHFLQEDCVDELIITRIPVLLGDGIPLFGLLDQALSFKHEGTLVFQNGLVKSHYKRAGN
ncbi:dihydrofolate reductase family protein [Flavihumibacter fluvii]|uniref:dihydrofolate reductase family protein n=1 Tax=Flavihumibacter fluvii TaxID=2838157 RepID=UPI001BDE9DE2|nr:dihydrofolate reductase family protein [Flavihumibacter fluvii]ULQ52706.1 dihydrofolate reductase family protein [Flavihumibacter fluvii]